MGNTLKYSIFLILEDRNMSEIQALWKDAIIDL